MMWAGEAQSEVDMDGRSKKLFLSVGAVLSLAACQQKSPESVFPESSQKTSACPEQSIPTEFLVVWEDGTRSLVRSENAELFKENFLNKHLDRVKHVEFNKVLKLNDRLRPSLEQATGQVQQTGTELDTWGQSKVESQSVWDQGVEGHGIKVGIIDSMVDTGHPQLTANLDVNEKEANGTAGVDDDGNGFADDVYGYDFYNKSSSWAPALENAHGTHVAGVVAAERSANSPMSGLAPKAKIIPANFMDQEGAGTLADAVEAIHYVVNRGAKVINASWGGACSSGLLKETIQNLAQQNVLFVAASGNEGIDLDSTPTYPASYQGPTQLTVAATYSSDNMTSWSNSSFKFVQLAAPGANILSTVPGRSYEFLSGTSMAAPFVSGAAALIWSARPQASAAQVRQALLQSIDVRDYRVETRGRLNVRKAYETLLQIVP